MANCSKLLVNKEIIVTKLAKPGGHVKKGGKAWKGSGLSLFDLGRNYLSLK